MVQNCAGWSAEASDAVVSAITQLGLNLTELSDRLLNIETALTKQNVKIDNLAVIPDRMTAVESGLLKLNRGHCNLTKGLNKMRGEARLDGPGLESLLREVVTALGR